MAQDPKTETEEEVAPPASKKKLILIIAAILALAGSSGAWYFLQHKSAHKPVAQYIEQKAPVFVTLETFTVNLQADPDEKMLQLDISLQVVNPETAELIKAQMPAVRNRILLLLGSKGSTDILNNEGKKQLNDEILAELKKPFAPKAKPPEVMGVFFTSFVIQ